MATNSEIWEGNGFEVVVPTSDDQEIAYPVPTDSLQPNIPAHMELTAQAVANSVNTISKKVDDLRGGDDDVYKEKVNVPDDNSSIEKTYGKNKQGLAAQGNGTNSTYWEDFAVLNEQGANSHKYYIKGDGTYGEIDVLATDEEVAFSNPIGQIVMYAGTSAPAGWQVCNGGAAHANLKSELGINNVPDLRNRLPVGYHEPYSDIGETMGNGRTSSIPTPRHNHSASSGGFSSSHYHAETNHNHGVILGYRTDVKGGGSNWSAVYTGGIDISTDHRAGSTGWATHDHSHGITVNHSGSTSTAEVMSTTNHGHGVYRTAVNFIIFHGGT